MMVYEEIRLVKPSLGLKDKALVPLFIITPYRATLKNIFVKFF